MTGVRKDWPEEEDNFLRENAHKMTLGQIADALGFQRERVRSYAEVRGITFLKLPPKPPRAPADRRGGCKGNHTGYWAYEAHREEAKRLYLSGLSAAQVSRALAASFPNHQAPSRNAIIGFVYRLGLTRDDRKAATHRIARPPKPIRLTREKPPTRATVEARAKAITPKSAKRSEPPRQPAPKPVLLSGREKPWTERKFAECAFPSAGERADTLSCCAPTEGHTYCAFHRSIIYATEQPPEPRRKRVRREPTFYDLERDAA